MGGRVATLKMKHLNLAAASSASQAVDQFCVRAKDQTESVIFIKLNTLFFTSRTERHKISHSLSKPISVALAWMICVQDLGWKN